MEVVKACLPPWNTSRDAKKGECLLKRHQEETSLKTRHVVKVKQGKCDFEKERHKAAMLNSIMMMLTTQSTVEN